MLVSNLQETGNLAEKHGSNLHVLHLTTADEVSLFSNKSLDEKKITCEVCLLLYIFQKTMRKRSLIKCNPSIKETSDRLFGRVARWKY